MDLNKLPQRSMLTILLFIAAFSSPIAPAIAESTVAKEATKAVAESRYKLVKVADGLYSHGDGNAFSAFLITDEGVIVIDPLDTNNSKAMLATIESLTDKPVTHVIYSHNHWDHIRGGKVFQDKGAIVLSHTDINKWLVEHPALNPAVAIPDKTWSGGRHDITLGGKTVELHHFGPSHGLGMTIFRFPAENTIYVVDLVVPNRVGFAYMPDFTPRGWLASLDKIEALEFEKVMFGHKEAVGTRETVAIQREFIVDLKTEIMRRLKAGENPMKVVSTIKLPKYESWTGYDDWLTMNAWRLMLETMMGV